MNKEKRNELQAKFPLIAALNYYTVTKDRNILDEKLLLAEKTNAPTDALFLITGESKWTRLKHISCPNFSLELINSMIDLSELDRNK